MKESRADRSFTYISVSCCVLLSIVMVYPLYYLLIYSFNDPVDASRGGIWLWPRQFSLAPYETIFATQNLLSAAWISVSRTVLGTFSSVLCTAVLAYALSRKELIGRSFFSKYFLITMFVGGGLIPYYMTLRWVGLLETYAVYIIPGLIGVFNMLLMKAYFENLPDGLIESASMDGANDIYIFFRIALPLSMPIIATISIFNAVGHWNSWQDNFFFTSNSPELTTLQLILVNLLKTANVSMSAANLNLDAIQRQKMTPESLRAAITILVTTPIILIYPFFQKHFTQGIMLGSIKG
ncbi:sugar ABC transporter permease [Paenibacillus sp. 32O-W]|jgi:putative aldouronate transport system permease protein|nr:carbohydrate ABC transporter permease [Paenibacillus sp. 32O-W]ALS27873.1 sugar ABC transporter permease [Paenibacillus sp. 32O-W]